MDGRPVWSHLCMDLSTSKKINPRSGSVSRVLYPPEGGWRSFIWTGRCRPALPHIGKRPTRWHYPGQVEDPLRRVQPAYLVLQAVGFSMPAMSPSPRCALTAPFHPCLIPDVRGHRRCVFCGTFPGSTGPRWPLAITVPCPARTFLHPSIVHRGLDGNGGPRRAATARPTPGIVIDYG
jgi:hypothetical protein